MEIGLKLEYFRINWVIIYPFLFDKGTLDNSLVNILLIDLSIFIDLSKYATVHLDFGPLCVVGPELGKI